MWLRVEYFPCPTRSLYQRHASVFPPRRVGFLRGRHGRRSHVPSVSAVHQYLETYLCDLERWLREWINVLKSTATFFAKAGRRILNPRPLQLFGKPILWVETTRYLVVKLATRLTWSAHIDQVRNEAVQRLGVLGSGLSVRNGVLLYK